MQTFASSLEVILLRFDQKSQKVIKKRMYAEKMGRWPPTPVGDWQTCFFGL